MKKNEYLRLLGGILTPAAGVGVLLCFLTALSNLSGGHEDAGRRQLEDAVRRAAVACYAAEGIYPPALSYLEERYGIQVDETRYAVTYDIFGSNLMPDITVLEKQP